LVESHLTVSIMILLRQNKLNYVILMKITQFIIVDTLKCIIMFTHSLRNAHNNIELVRDLLI